MKTKENKIQIVIDDKDNWLDIAFWKVKSVYISTTNEKLFIIYILNL